MKQEELLLKDLCSRLPYGVKVNEDIQGDFTLIGLTKERALTTCEVEGKFNNFPIELIKPYLFPLSSMTEEQKEELFFSYIHNDIFFDDFTDYFLAGELWHDICVSMDALPELVDWLNKNHFDYRGLIEKSLALDATGLNIY